MVQDSEAWLAAPTLIYGPRKAGTTLLLRLLDTSGEVFAFPSEMKLNLFYKRRDLVRRDAASAYFDACRHIDLAHRQFDGDGYAGRVQRIRQSHLDLSSVIRADAAAMVASLRRVAKPKTFVIKGIAGKIDSAEVIGFFQSLFPAGKLILITREPRFVSRAIYRARRRAGIRLGLLKLLRYALEPIKVRESQRRLLARTDLAVLQVRYEDIVSDMLEQTMQRVAAFLDVSFTDEFMRPTLLGEPTVVETSSRRTTAVFRDDARWSDDLEFREQLAISFAQCAGTLLYGSHEPNQRTAV